MRGSSRGPDGSPGPAPAPRGFAGRTAWRPLRASPGSSEGPSPPPFLTDPAPPLCSAPRLLPRTAAPAAALPPPAQDAGLGRFPRKLALFSGPPRNSHRSEGPPEHARSLWPSRGPTETPPAQTSRPGAPRPPPQHPRGASGSLSPPGSRLAPGGPGAAGRREPGPARSGAGAAAAAPTGAPGGRVARGAESPWPRTVAERSQPAAGALQGTGPGLPLPPRSSELALLPRLPAYSLPGGGPPRGRAWARDPVPRWALLRPCAQVRAPPRAPRPGLRARAPVSRRPGRCSRLALGSPPVLKFHPGSYPRASAPDFSPFPLCPRP